MNEKLPFADRKEWAKSLYMKLGTSIRDTALTVGVEEAVVRQWIGEDAWEARRSSLGISKASQLRIYYSELEKINTKLIASADPSPKDMELHAKYTACIKNLEVGLTVSEIIEVFELFTQWLRRKDQALTRKVIVQLDAFIKQRIAA